MSENPPVALMLLPLPLVVGSVIGVVVGFATSSWLWAIVALVVAAMTIGAVAFLVAESLALRLLKARPLEAGGSLALRNQLEELCARTGLAEPELYTVGSGAPAIASVGRVSSALVVTDGLTDDLTVVELEEVADAIANAEGSEIHAIEHEARGMCHAIGADLESITFFDDVEEERAVGDRQWIGAWQGLVAVFDHPVFEMLDHTGTGIGDLAQRGVEVHGGVFGEERVLVEF